MRIGIMAAWNTNSGVAMHAEPIGKALIEMGHDVSVFTFHKNDYHGEWITAKDEKFVHRCFGTRTGTNALDPRPLMEHKYDILMVEDIGMLPIDKLSNLVPVLKKKAKLVHVVHENKMCDHSWFYKIDFDRVVYFDHRQDFLKKVYPDPVYIPFPCYKLRKGAKKAARKRLKLPLDKKIIYSFDLRGYHPYYRELPPKLKKKAVLLHLVPRGYQMLEALTPEPWRIVRTVGSLSTREFDDYLFASDAAIFHKFQSRFHAVLSSTVYESLGAGCPIFVPQQSDFFHNFPNEVVHYRDITALNKQLSDYISDKKKRDRLNKEAEKFVVAHSPRAIAWEFVRLFEEMLNG